MSSSRLRAARRLKSMPLLTALMLSFGTGFQASLCPPGMDMGSEMVMAMDEAPTEQSTGVHCALGTSMNEDGGTSCPLSVGGTGPCGTTAPVPAVAFLIGPPPSQIDFPPITARSAPSELFTRVHRPPPRA